MLYSQSGQVATHYGWGAPGSGNPGIEPRLIVTEPAVLGNPNFTMALADGYGGGLAFLALDPMQGPGLPILGVPVLLGLSSGLTIIPLGQLNGAGAGAGWWSGTFGIPAAPTLSGVKLFGQAYVADPGTAFGFSASDGVELRFFDPR